MLPIILPLLPITLPTSGIVRNVVNVIVLGFSFSFAAPVGPWDGDAVPASKLD